MSSCRKVVFDVDDTMWGLNDRVFRNLGVDSSHIKSFSIMSSDNTLSDKEKKAILAAYSSTQIFENIEWYDGIELIDELETYGCKVYINSNNYTLEIANIKRQQLKSIVHIPDERVRMNIITEHTNKHMDTDMFILVDDSPFNISKSTAIHNISLRKSYNMSESAREIIGNKEVIWCDTFNEIIETIIKLLISDKGGE